MDISTLRVTDAHVHIFPDAIAQKAADSIGGFYGIPMWGDGTLETLQANCAKHRIARCFIHSVATVPQQVRKINDFIASCAKASGGALIGFATMHADYPDFAGELDRALEMGLVGVKLHPDMQRFAVDDPRIMRLYEQMSLRKMPLVAHAGDTRYDYSNPDRIAHVLRSFPDMKVQAAHLGGYSHWDDVMEQFEGLGAYTDTSSSFFAMDNELAVRLIRFFGADHTMFGSDYPMWDVGRELERFMMLDLTEGEQIAILQDASDAFLRK